MSNESQAVEEAYVDDLIGPAESDQSRDEQPIPFEPEDDSGLEPEKTDPPPEKPDSEKEERPEDEKPEEKAPTVEDLQKQLDELNGRLETTDKRFRDNQANYHREHQQRLALEKEIRELKAARPKADPDDDSWFDDPEPNGTPEQPAQPSDAEKRLEKLEQEARERAEREAQSAWNEAEAPVKESHADYDDVVYKTFQPAFEKDEALQREFAEKGATPEAAYKIGKRLAQRRALESDPEAYRKQLRDELKQELLEELGQTGKPAPSATENPDPADDPAAMSMPPDTGGLSGGDAGSVVDELF